MDVTIFLFVQVYLANHVGENRPYVIKVIKLSGLTKKERYDVFVLFVSHSDGGFPCETGSPKAMKKGFLSS